MIESGAAPASPLENTKQKLLSSVTTRASRETQTCARRNLSHNRESTMPPDPPYGGPTIVHALHVTAAGKHF